MMSECKKEQFRSIVPLIRNQIPRHIRESESILPDFLEAYYEWLELEGNATEIINQASNVQYVNCSISRFFEEFRREYLVNIPSNVLVDKSSLLKNIRDMYRAKGTEKAIKFLFRILYNEEIEITYPAEKILKPSDGNWIQYTYIKCSYPNSDIYNLLNRKIFTSLIACDVLSSPIGNFSIGDVVEVVGIGGIVSATATVYSIVSSSISLTDVVGYINSGFIIRNTSNLETLVVSSVTNKDSSAIVENIILGSDGLYEITLSNISRTFYPNIKAYTKDNLDDIEFVVAPLIGSYTIIDAGSGYAEGTIIPVSGGDGSGFSASIRSVKTNITSAPGTFDFFPENILPTNQLKYTPKSSETLSFLFPVGSKIIVDGVKHEVIFIDSANNSIFLDGILSGTEDLNLIYRAYDDDIRSILAVNIDSPGSGYTIPPIANLSFLGDGNAIIEFHVSGMYKTPGFYRNDKGQPDSTMRIQDGKLYQKFSYVIRSGQDISTYKTVLKNTVHPAGLYVSSEVVIRSDSTSGNGSVKISDGQIRKIVLFMFLEPELGYSGTSINYDPLQILPYDPLQILPYENDYIGWAFGTDDDYDYNGNLRRVVVSHAETFITLFMDHHQIFSTSTTIGTYAEDLIGAYKDAEIQSLLVSSGSVIAHESYVSIEN